MLRGGPLSVARAPSAAGGAIVGRVAVAAVEVAALVGGHFHPLQDGRQCIWLLHQRRLPQPLQLVRCVPHARSPCQ